MFALGVIVSFVLTFLLVVVLPISIILVFVLGARQKDKKKKKKLLIVGSCLLVFYLLLVAYNRYAHYRYSDQKTTERQQLLGVTPDIWVPKNHKVNFSSEGAYVDMGIEPAHNDGYTLRVDQSTIQSYDFRGTIKLYGYHLSQMNLVFSPKLNKCGFRPIISQLVENISTEKLNTCVLIKNLPDSSRIYSDSDSAAMNTQYARFATVKGDTLIIIEMDHQYRQPKLTDPKNKTTLTAIDILTNLERTIKP